MTIRQAPDTDRSRAQRTDRGRLRVAMVVLSAGVALVGAAVIFTQAGHDNASDRSVVATLRVPGHPGALLAGTDALWVALRTGVNPSTYRDEPSLVRLNLTTGAVEETVDLGGGAPGFAVRVGDSIWLTNSPTSHAAPGELVELDWATGQIRGRTPLNGPAGPLTFGDGSLWVMLSGDNVSDGANLVRIDPATRAQVGPPIHVSDRRSINVTYSDGVIWATAHDDGMLARIDPATGSIQKLRVGNFPVGVVFAGDSLWIANRGDATVSRVDPKTMQVLGDPIHVGKNPTWITALGENVWVSNQDDGTVSRIDVTTGQTVNPPIRIAPPSSDQPAAHFMADDGTSLWVESVTGQIVSRIDPSR